MVLRDQLTPELGKKLTELSAQGWSRRRLAQYVCETLNWRGPGGQFQLMEARKLLRQLEKKHQLELQPVERTVPKAKPVPAYTAEPIVVEKLAEVGEVELVLLPPGPSPQGLLWRSILAHHPLGAGPLCGAQLRYLIRSPKGLLGAMAFSAAAQHVRVRDDWIGWTRRAQIHHRHRVVNNSRFLILPNVEVPCLASHALSLAAGRLPRDWKERYGYEPVLLESYVDTSEHLGFCYYVANWDCLGETQGRGRQDAKHQKSLPPKRVFVYPLRRDARKQLCQEPPIPPSHHPASHWTEQECGRARLPQRLRQRLQVMLGDFFARPTANIPQACGSWVKAKAAYRFFKNPQVKKDFILESHFEATAARVAEHPVVLAVQDTTFLDYSTHPQTKDLGPIGSKSKDQSLGLVVHGTMAFTPSGLPLGLIDLQSWARDPEDFGKRHRRKELPIDQKESFKWIQSFRQTKVLQERCRDTHLISVGDRESDIYELFLEATWPGAPDLVVRAERDRALSQEEHQLLWAKMEQEPVQASYKLEVTAGKNRTARTAHLDIRFAEVTLKPPQRLSHKPPVKLWAVYAVEAGTEPNAKEKLEWMLLTTLEVKSVEDALRIIDYYKQRWGIERFHKVLKSGCRIEDRQLGTADRLEACLALDAMVAWRIYYCCHLAREVPEAPCTIFFEEEEWKAATAFVSRQRQPADQEPTLKEMVELVAGLGGWMGRSCDDPPGTEVLWRGFQTLDIITDAWNAFGPEAKPTTPKPTVPSYLDSG
jgi:hypothetical protein